MLKLKIVVLIGLFTINCLMEGTSYSKAFPVVINTWAFSNATQKAWNLLLNGSSALDAIEFGCSVCEDEQCKHTVGWGGSPDENGETTLDAMIMDGPTHDVGAVGALRRVKNVISVARKVLENTEHTLLVGDQATRFALQMGFKEQSLTSNWSQNSFDNWKRNKCQPNYWRNVYPDPKTSCGPYASYKTVAKSERNTRQNLVNESNHDTIGMVAIDLYGRIAVGTSTNGMIHKIPGRVGDSPIPGAGAYVDQDVGGAAATGNGDIIMRFLPSYQTIENLRQGMNPTQAAEEALKRIRNKYPNAQVGIVVAGANGDFGAACINIPKGFPYSVSNKFLSNVTVKRVSCLS